ncbi:MAG: class I mannose-6-phosphate isomerase [Candidatus Sumerlaeaceae bacterium]
MRQSNYDKFPVCHIDGFDDQCWAGWEEIGAQLRATVDQRGTKAVIIECYPGAHDDELLPALSQQLKAARVINMRDLLLPPEEIAKLVERDVTDDPVFGYLSSLELLDCFNTEKFFEQLREVQNGAGLMLVYGAGASFFSSAQPQSNILVYADLARWELQMRMRRNEISNLGADNADEKWSLQYKRAFFVDWRVADKHKKHALKRADFVLDTNTAGQPKLITREAFRGALDQVSSRPFRVVPFFDPAPWGGQWMKEVCDLDRSAPNYGWCFDCVPEENSLLLGFGGHTVEIPSIDLVFFRPRELLGEAVHGRFGTEFPIRFDFLDTMGGGKLSFQVHPLTEYIQEKFGMHYTQDESYYMLDAGPDACVYLGLKDDIDRSEMTLELVRAETGECTFDDTKYVNRYPAKKHDHFLIPAGTVHCSGAEAMVLEISATPYNFTFKMWDWGRMGLDGKPRPVHLAHGIANIGWDRTTAWVQRELINTVSEIAQGEGWREERTGLHEREFIETRRHWFTGTVPHDTNGGVNVLNLVEGEEAIVESPTGAFAPFVIHYAETFIVPAAVGPYTIRPHGPGKAQQCATLKACVRN